MVGGRLLRASRRLRRIAVDWLELDPQRELYLQDNDTIAARDLVCAIAERYNVTANDYCRSMRQVGRWGGGPEIVAISNALRRPIHVYELASTTCEEGKKGSSTFSFKRIARFGSPAFDRRNARAIHILSADSRFPRIKAGDQRETGDHFLTILPASKTNTSSKTSTKKES
jgi:hypothetical protein